MFKIIKKARLSENIVRMDVEAPLVAKKAAPGQFLVVRTHQKGERIPLTIADNTDRTVALVFQEVGASTKMLGAMKEGDNILDVLGPLGNATEVENFGTVVCVGGGVGMAVIYPIVKALRHKGNRIISISGARCEDLLIFRDEIKKNSDSTYITTDDGSCGRKGFVSDELKDLIASGEKIDRVIAVGPVPMMRAVAEVTRQHKIKTIVSLNAMMLDATGMCGVCRVVINGQIRFSCVDGPEFDAHEVDFKELSSRLNAYKSEEKIAMERCEKCR